MGKYKTRLIHAKLIKDFLHECGIEPIEEVDNPFREGFKSWRYYVVPEFTEALEYYYNSKEMTYEEVCKYISQEANDGHIHTIIDRSGKAPNDECIFRIIDSKQSIIIKTRRK